MHTHKHTIFIRATLLPLLYTVVLNYIFLRKVILLSFISVFVCVFNPQIQESKTGKHGGIDLNPALEPSAQLASPTGTMIERDSVSRK